MNSYSDHGTDELLSLAMLLDGHCLRLDWCTGREMAGGVKHTFGIPTCGGGPSGWQQAPQAELDQMQAHAAVP